MKLAPVAQNFYEWLALKAGLVPEPLAYSHFGFLLSKFLLEAVDLGVFETIGHQKLAPAQVAATCELNEHAVISLINVLSTMDLLKIKQGKVWLTPPAKKWILKDSPNSLYWLMIFDNRVCFKWMDHTSEFLKTGRGLQYHDTFTKEEWFYYQKAMEAAAKATSREATRKLTLPKGATNMLDIGGSHGLYSRALCRKHRGLTSVILDLPEAIEQITSTDESEAIVYKPGNALTDDLGAEQYDLVLMASVAHHFTAEQNMVVARKVYHALKPGGYFTIMEVMRQDSTNNMLSAVGDLFFALSSTSGLWSLAQIQEWQQAAGLTSSGVNRFLTIPGYVAITAKKD